MRILPGECVPRGLKRELPDYETSTVPEMGWAGKSNGELLVLGRITTSKFWSRSCQLRDC